MPTAEIEGARCAHNRLLVTLEGLDGETLRQPSLLPGWTIGHILVHLAYDAESHVRLLASALRGVPTERYPGGMAQRNAEIESRSKDMAIVAFVASTIADLEAMWGQMTPTAWGQVGSGLGRREPANTLPWRRWREVEIHHADLGLATFRPADWSRDFLRRELRLAEMAWRATRTVGLTGLPSAALRLPPPVRLAWFLGRASIDGLPDQVAD